MRVALLVMWLAQWIWLPLVWVHGEPATATATPTETASATATWTPTATPSATWTATATPAGAVLRITFMRCTTRHEYVRVSNIGGATATLASWRLVSVVGPQTFVFPAYQLAPGASVTVSSGPDAPATGGSNLRWTTAYIWNDSGDRAELRTATGVVVDARNC